MVMKMLKTHKYDWQTDYHEHPTTVPTVQPFHLSLQHQNNSLSLGHFITSLCNLTLHKRPMVLDLAYHSTLMRKEDFKAKSSPFFYFCFSFKGLSSSISIHPTELSAERSPFHICTTSNYLKHLFFWQVPFFFHFTAHHFIFLKPAPQNPSLPITNTDELSHAYPGCKP